MGVITAGVLALAVIGTLVGTASGDSRKDPVTLTDALVTAVAQASRSCPTLTAARLAGQVMATTAFEPTADGGIAGLSAAAWEQWKPWDGAVPGDDTASLLGLAHLTCDLVGQLRVSGFQGDLWPLAVAAIASSLDHVRAAAGVPVSVADVVDRAQAYAIQYAGRVGGTPSPVPQTSADSSPTGEPIATGPASPTPGTSAPASTTLTRGPTGSNDFSVSPSPTSVSVVRGSATTVTVKTAVTAGSAQSVTLSASGLPAGTTASFSPATVTAGGSSTLTLQTSGYYTPTGTSTVTITANGSVTHVASVSLAVTSGPACSSPGQKLGNPGFESGVSPWSASTGVIDDYTERSAHSGARFAWLGGYGDTSTTKLSQTVSLPSGCASYTFSFWLHIDSSESTSSTQYDRMTVQVLDSGGTVLKTLATYSNLDEANGYRQKSFNLASYAGQTIQVKFTAVEDYSRQTSFVIDDAAVSVA